MNNIVPTIYLTLVSIILIPISYLITIPIIKFIYNTYILRLLKNRKDCKQYNQKKCNTLLNIYIKHKLWTLAINNIENALELETAITRNMKIYYFKKIGYMYRQINYKILSSKYENITLNLELESG